MLKNKHRIIFFSLILFSSYSAITLGQTWDEGHLIKQGKIVLNYLFSFGKMEEDIFRREYYSPIYYTIKYLFLQVFPIKYQIEASHLINLIFSFATIIGIKKICKEFFNQKVAILTFLILFLFPAFNGHMAFNSKDIIIAFCHVWIFYLLIKYLKLQSKNLSNKYIYYVGILLAIGTGINLFFIGSLLPLFLIILIDIFFIKKFSNKNFLKKKFIFDILKSFLIFYLLLIIFWIDTHPNILVLPFKFFIEWSFSDLWRGYPFILINGEYFIYKDIPKSYLFINYIYKSPEYFLTSYVIFLILFSKMIFFFNKQFTNFIYKLILISSMIFYPFILLYLTPFSIYDGFRHVLWMIPYMCIIPALVTYYLIENYKTTFSKILIFFQSMLLINFLFTFIIITPYQYTYLNLLNGNVEKYYQRFENDYWGSSLKELINNTPLDKKSKITLSTCGIAEDVAKNYFKKAGYVNLSFESLDKSEFIIMTNRATNINKDKQYSSDNVTNCFDKFNGNNISRVERKGVTLSVIRKIN